MRQTVIKYSKLPDDLIKIVGFENVVGLKRIEKEFGNIIQQEYSKSTPYYYKTDPLTISIKSKDDVDCVLIKIDQVIPKEEFQKMITTMKAAGNRLVDIRKSTDTRVHEIKI